MKKSGSGMELFIPQLGNMLSMKRQRFKAQPHVRLGYPTKYHDTYPPHSEGGLMETEGGRVPFLKESTR